MVFSGLYLQHTREYQYYCDKSLIFDRWMPTISGSLLLSVDGVLSSMAIRDFIRASSDAGPEQTGTHFDCAPLLSTCRYYGVLSSGAGVGVGSAMKSWRV
jgi:hypothetical protein